MRDLKVGDTTTYTKSGEKVRIVNIRKTDIAIAGRLTEYQCGYLTGHYKGKITHLPISQVNK